MHEFFLFGHTLIFANIRLSFFAGESFNREQKKTWRYLLQDSLSIHTHVG